MQQNTVMYEVESPMMPNFTESGNMAPRPRRMSSYEMLLDPGLPESPQWAPKFSPRGRMPEMSSPLPPPIYSPQTTGPVMSPAVTASSASPLVVTVCEGPQIRQQHTQLSAQQMLLDPGLSEGAGPGSPTLGPSPVELKNTFMGQESSPHGEK